MRGRRKCNRDKATTATQTQIRLVDPGNTRIEGRARDLAIFDPVIDGKLRGHDVAAIRNLKVEDIRPGELFAEVAVVLNAI